MARRSLRRIGALTLPPTLTRRRRSGKYVSKHALEGLVPAANRYRPRQGFAAPLADRFCGAGTERVQERPMDCHTGGHATPAKRSERAFFEGFLAGGEISGLRRQQTRLECAGSTAIVGRSKPRRELGPIPESKEGVEEIYSFRCPIVR